MDISQLGVEGVEEAATEKLEQLSMMASVCMILILRAGGKIEITQAEYESVAGHPMLTQCRASSDGHSVSISVEPYGRGELN